CSTRASRRTTQQDSNCGWMKLRWQVNNDASKRFLRTFYEAIELPCKDWMNSLRPWSEIVEAGAREWGRTPALLDIALISAGISAKEERGAFGAGFDDKSIPLCETLRYARLKSGAYQWWLSNLNRGSEHLVALTTLLCWATPRTILLIKDCVGPLVDALERRAWHRLVDRIKRTVSIWGRSDASGLALREVQSDRLFLALALRLSPVDRDQFICSKFIRYSGDDRKILEMACDSAVRLACAGILQWSDAVDMIRRGYMLDIDPITLHRAVSSEFRIPEELAIQICTTAQHFPLALVYNAQSVLQASIAATGKPVGEIALRDQWFG
uniref:hypothetical protein n=1 Tax=Bradyrhizobium sp. SZCCHNS2096 TaxID=3057309 RepID=UPI0029168B61